MNCLLRRKVALLLMPVLTFGFAPLNAQTDTVAPLYKRTSNSFGIEWKDQTCADILERQYNIVVNVGNSIRFEDNRVVLAYHNKAVMQEVITDPFDGLAIDLMIRDQFACGRPNDFNKSVIFDGVMLKPVFRDEIFEVNSALSDYRLISVLGTIPEALQNVAVSPSVLAIKNKKACAYRYPVYLPSKDYRLIPVEPKLISFANQLMRNEGIVNSEEVYFDFNRGRSTAVTPTQLSFFAGTADSVEILSFTSIEGDSADNEALHWARARHMLSEIQKYRKFNPASVSIQAKENWQQFHFQLQLVGMDRVSEWPRDSCRAFVMRDTTNNWDSLLFAQRKSVALLHYNGTFDADTSNIAWLEMNLRTAIMEKNWQLANNAMARIFYNEKKAEALFEPGIVEAVTHQPELVQNASALFSKYGRSKDMRVIAFVNGWLARSAQLSAEAKFNLLQLYNITTKALLDQWDIYSSMLAKVLHPSKVEAMVKTMASDILLVNYHLAAIEYYGHVNQRDKLHESFEYIRKYFEEEVLSMEDELNLCLFFNSWSMYRLTVDKLLQRIGDVDFDETAAFVLAQSLSAYDEDISADVRSKIHRRAIGFNENRWCEWINNDFQLMREQSVKDIFCKECEME